MEENETKQKLIHSPLVDGEVTVWWRIGKKINLFSCGSPGDSLAVTWCRMRVRKETHKASGEALAFCGNETIWAESGCLGSFGSGSKIHEAMECE